jgi:hypothetical protein
MKTWRFANPRSIRLFELDQHVIAIAIGTKPRSCQGPKLAVLASGRLVLHCECAEECTRHPEREDDYFIVQPLTGLHRKREIEVLHRDGCDLVRVEVLSTGELAQSASVGSAIFGVSQDFSLEAAFKDAIGKFDLKTGQSPGLVEVVSMGALYGGFAGFSRLFVRVEKTESRLLDATMSVPVSSRSKRSASKIGGIAKA